MSALSAFRLVRHRRLLSHKATLDPQALPDSDLTSIHGYPDIQSSNLPFEVVKSTLRLRLAESASDVFPPLKSTVAGLLGVIDFVEVRDFQLSVVFVVLTVFRQPLRTYKIAKIWNRSWEPSSQLSTIMPIILQRPLSPHVSRVFRRMSCRFYLSDAH